MQSITSLVNQVRCDFPAITFVTSTGFLWSPSTQTIHYIKSSNDFAALLHEVGHAQLSHNAYSRDITLLEMERAAWEYAMTHLAKKYKVAITNECIEEALDSYRDWLHARSLCPQCHATGIQVKNNEYACVACHSRWQVNNARSCALRRHKLNNAHI